MSKERIQEDDPRWDWKTMGNKKRGVRQPDGSVRIESAPTSNKSEAIKALERIAKHDLTDYKSPSKTALIVKTKPPQQAGFKQYGDKGYNPVGKNVTKN